MYYIKKLPNVYCVCTPTTSIVLFLSGILMVIYLPYVEKKKECTMKYLKQENAHTDNFPIKKGIKAERH